MNLKLIVVLIFIFLIGVISSLVTYTFSYNQALAYVKSKYLEEIPSPWGALYKDIYPILNIQGKIVEKNAETLRLENKGDYISVSLLPGQEIIQGNSFTAADLENWRRADPSQLIPGVDIFINGYFHPEKKSIVPVVIFIINR